MARRVASELRLRKLELPMHLLDEKTRAALSERLARSPDAKDAFQSAVTEFASRPGPKAKN